MVLCGQDEFAKVVDELVCFSVCDPYAMCAWRESMSVEPGHISFLADSTGATTRQWGLSQDLRTVSLAERSVRFSMLIDDGVVVALNKVDDAAGDAAKLLGQCSVFQ
jgi:peroxiredoxin|eukprot:COSAG02_NODE_2179_length_9586_cov_14.521395_2_plen_107_part_00